MSANNTVHLLLLLAEFWRAPNEAFQDAVSTGTLDAELALPEKYEPFQGLLPPYSALCDFYSRYLDGAGDLLPVESLFKKWTDDPSARLPIAGDRGYFMGDSAMHVQYLLTSCGLSIPPTYCMTPDHLSLLLELAAFLLDHRSLDDYRRFIAQHFDWLKDLECAFIHCQPNDRLEMQARNFYLSALQVLQQTIACELARSNKL